MNWRRFRQGFDWKMVTALAATVFLLIVLNVIIQRGHYLDETLRQQDRLTQTVKAQTVTLDRLNRNAIAAAKAAKAERKRLRHQIAELADLLRVHGIAVPDSVIHPPRRAAPSPTRHRNHAVKPHRKHGKAKGHKPKPWNPRGCYMVVDNCLPYRPGPA